MTAAMNGGVPPMMGSTYGEGGFFGGGGERQHSRSGSVSSVSSSSLSLMSRPGSASGGLGCVGPDGSVYRTGYGGHGHGHGRFLPHAAHLSSPHHHRDDSSSATSAFSTDLSSPADSPPTHPAHALAHPSLQAHHVALAAAGAQGLPPASFGGKAHLARAHPTRIRSVREAASPYPRDADSVYSSSSETEDVASLYFGAGGGGGGGGGGSGHPSPPDYTSMYVNPGQQDAFGAAGQFGRMTLGPDHALESLAASVRAATTTSAADRAKQIFVQAWYV